MADDVRRCVLRDTRVLQQRHDSLPDRVKDVAITEPSGPLEASKSLPDGVRAVTKLVRFECRKDIAGLAGSDKAAERR